MESNPGPNLVFRSERDSRNLGRVVHSEVHNSDV